MKKEGIQTRKRKPKAQTPMKPMGKLVFSSIGFKNILYSFAFNVDKILPPMIPSQIQMPHHEMHTQPLPAHEHYINASQASSHLRHAP